MSVTKVLLDILIVLLVAKAAAEIAERVNVPAVVAEILAGILIGPSLFGLVGAGASGGGDEVLRVLGELGVILLLLDVGMEMDLGELAAVGRASCLVAVAGVAVPFAAGWVVGAAFGMSGNEAMFVGAALTATSVGITARVFGDLRALATVEARTVLGAAVADDVIGLVILTVVVRLASEGGVSPLAVAGIVAVAIGFLLVTSVCGVRLAPSLFANLARFSRSSGTLVAVALAFTLAVAELASAAKLAPIVGAFVAGLALSRSEVAGRIRSELTPVGHLLIPVFFLQIGIDAEIGQFAHGKVLGLAGALLAVAIAGKLLSAIGLWGSPGDRLLVGIGMIPRGEVGLIFATLGLREGIFGVDIYAALLLVVLASTLLTPPLLRWRLLKMRAARAETAPAAAAKPEGGWLTVTPGPGGGVVDLAADPPPSAALTVGFEAALLGDRHQPGPRLLSWLGRLPDGPVRWDKPSRELLFKVLETGGLRAWRFLALTGLLDRGLPELGAALARRQADPFELDPTKALRWSRLSRLRELAGWRTLRHPEWALLAAVILDATDEDTGPVNGGAAPVVIARRIVQRLDLGAAAEQSVAGMVADAGLLPAAARLVTALDEESVLQLAVHLGSAEQARSVALVAEASDRLSSLERERLRVLHDALQAVLAHPELTGRAAANAVEQRRAAAQRSTVDPAARERIGAAPRAYLLATAPAEVVAHAALCEPRPARDEVRVRCEPSGVDGGFRVDIVARDRVGLLAADTFVLSEAGLNVHDATAATWGDGCALASFRVSAAEAPDPDELERELRASLKRAPVPAPAPDAVVEFDGVASPWHTLCRVAAPDRPGLLFAITAAFAASGVDVHSAKVTTIGLGALDLFELTERDGHKLSRAREDEIRRCLALGAVAARRRRGGRQRGQAPVMSMSENRQEGATEGKQLGDPREMTTS